MTIYQELTNHFKQLSVYDEILSILQWDTATMMPLNSRTSRITQINLITKRKKEIFKLIDKFGLFNKVDFSKLNNDELKNLELMKKKFDVYSNIPSELLVKLQKLSYECEGKWREAKEKIITKL